MKYNKFFFGPSIANSPCLLPLSFLSSLFILLRVKLVYSYINLSSLLATNKRLSLLKRQFSPTPVIFSINLH